MSTRTRSFGSSSRESHDSSSFYNRRLYGSVQEVDLRDEDLNEVPGQYLNQVLRGDSRDLFIPDNSTQLMITSPPYNVGKDYDEDLSLEEYLELIHDVMKEIHRILIPGGRACINVANVGRKPYLPLNHLINQIMLELGFFMRGEIIWDKGASAGSSCAWGSWQSPSNPVLRDVHEHIMIHTAGLLWKEGTVVAKIEQALSPAMSFWSTPRAFDLHRRISTKGEASCSVSCGASLPVDPTLLVLRRYHSRSILWCGTIV